MEIKLPNYVRYVVILIGLYLLLFFLQSFSSILIPICFSALFALLLLPMARALEKHMPRALSITISLVVVILILGLLVWFLSSKIASFSAELQEINAKISLLIAKFQQMLYERFGIKPTNKNEFLQKAMGSITQTGTAFLGSTISLTTGALTVLTLIPIYVFCMLYYRDHLRQFMFQFISVDRRGSLMSTVDNIQHVVQGYLSGLLIVIVIVSVLNSTGLLIMGVKYAIFFGVLASILTIIPYIGILIGALLPALFVFVSTGSVGQMLIVVGIFAFVQFLEGNFITPFVVGSRVSINPFAAIVALILGGEVWGAPGMILSIPLIAILKVLFDASEPLKPFGYLLGDIQAEEKGNKLLQRFNRRRKK
ncbi:AI-2E family transporter [Rufibacter quisquiliarum]|uniref:Putative PurR-regulated permease PerM n=1 Tax=Rufibacter quisquiliarum TaxID=1549639 RepID=A0A839GVB8_9BACT|nr:AI-2E family transporter [Rufibacter quisquiliarum]MBA9078696.1 putative PurR-regulated permease PerM [Rufibacter quisquiliarum]